MTIPDDRLNEWAALADAATPGPWFYNGYSAVFSKPMGEEYEAFWTEERENDGHTYDHRVGEICPACGERPAVYGDAAKPEVRGQRFGTYWDCAFHKDAYDVDPVVASTPSQMGDTATGRHASDAAFIAAARTAVPQLIEAVRQARAELDRLNALLDVWSGRPLKIRAEKAEAERDALQARLDAVRELAERTPHKTTDYEGTVTGYLINANDLNAALNGRRNE